jgi:hypothetical protein
MKIIFIMLVNSFFIKELIIKMEINKIILN